MTGESSTADADVRGLLARYASVLDRARTPEARPLVVRRLAVGTDRQLTEHVRRSLDALARSYRMRAAVAAEPDPDEADDARRVDGFAASLPPVPSRWQRLWPIIVALLLAQALLSSFVPHLLLELLTGGGGDDPRREAYEDATALATGLKELTNLDIGSVGQMTDLILHSNIVVIFLVLFFVCLAAYLTQRPLANGFLLSRRLLAAGGVLEHERRVFARLQAIPPWPHRHDVIAGALFGTSILLVGLLVLPGYVEGTVNSYSSGGTSIWEDSVVGVVEVSHQSPLLAIAIAAGALGTVRLGWLAARGDRGIWRSRLAVTGALAAVLAGAVIVYRSSDHTPPAVEVHLPAGLSTIRDGKRTLDVELACNEECVLADVQLDTGGGDPAVRRTPVRFGSEHELRRPSDPDLAITFLDGMRMRWSYRLELSKEQLAWFESRMTPSDVDDAAWGTLEFTVDDYGDNRSIAPIYID